MGEKREGKKRGRGKEGRGEGATMLPCLLTLSL